MVTDVALVTERQPMWATTAERARGVAAVTAGAFCREVGRCQEFGGQHPASARCR